MTTAWTVINDRYSNEPITDTQEALQKAFNDMGWDVKLRERGDGEALVDDNNGEIVALPDETL